MEQLNSWIIDSTPEYLALHKPVTILCQGDAEDSASLTSMVNQQFGGNVHLLNRLDRPVQGLVLFSKSKAFTNAYLKQQREGNIEKTYWAIVEGKVEQDGLRDEYLIHDKRRHKAFITEDTKNARQVVLNYRIIKRLDNYTVLKISLQSGKFHQIRAQMAHMGHPIKGDVKYGARRKNKDRSIYLCAVGMKFLSAKGKTINITTRPHKDVLWDLVTED